MLDGLLGPTSHKFQSAKHECDGGERKPVSRCFRDSLRLFKTTLRCVNIRGLAHELMDRESRQRERLALAIPAAAECVRAALECSHSVGVKLLPR